MELSKIIGSNIKLYREKLGYTQDHLASLLGVDRSLISYYERGEREISLAQLNKIADLFAVDLEDLAEQNLVTLKTNLAFAFRGDGISPVDAPGIASFQQIVKNYLKMLHIKNGKK
jgi:transcriptional regulator with XRE-family HTH domain